MIWIQREREAREARLLDREIRAQERHHQSELKHLKKHKEAAAAAAELQKNATQVHTQLSQLHKHVPGTPLQTPRSPRESLDKSDLKGQFQHDSKDKVEALATTSASASSVVCDLKMLFMFLVSFACNVVSNVLFYRIQKATHHTTIKRQSQAL